MLRTRYTRISVVHPDVAAHVTFTSNARLNVRVHAHPPRDDNKGTLLLVSCCEVDDAQRRLDRREANVYDTQREIPKNV